MREQGGNIFNMDGAGVRGGATKRYVYSSAYMTLKVVVLLQHSLYVSYFNNL
jgi:hypothetical protein